MATAHEYKVTLPIYSGRPDPSWEIDSSHKSLKKIKEHHERAKSSNLSYAHHQVEAKLGYRGFLVHHKDSEHPDLIVGPETHEFQKALLETMPKELQPSGLHPKVIQMISTSRAPKAKPEPSASFLAQPKGTSDAPVLDLAKWNDDSFILKHNNCYNYGNDQTTNTIAQPGKGSGQIYHSFTNDEVTQAAIRDGLKMLSRQPGPSDPSPSSSDAPDGYWIVALVVAEGIDYHWYRLDSNKRWSHKPGRTPATIYDGDGDLITDPRNAACKWPPYKFHAFMTTKKDIPIA